MGRCWVRRGGRIICATCSVTTCFPRLLEDPPDQEPDFDHDQLLEATNRINEILERAVRALPDTGVEIAFLAVRGPTGQDDCLRLAYVDTSEETTTYLD